MIIEAGYDVFELLAPTLLRRRRPRDRTWVLVMDEDLRFLYRTRVAVGSGDPVEKHAAAILNALNKKPHMRPHFFVVGRLDTSFRCPDTDYSYDDGGHLDDYDQALRDSPLLGTFELIGTIHTNGEGVCSTVPRFSFRDYPLLEHLPRSESFAGPHSNEPDCCPACTRRSERLRANRARAEAVEELERQLGN